MWDSEKSLQRAQRMSKAEGYCAFLLQMAFYLFWVGEMSDQQPIAPFLA